MNLRTEVISGRRLLISMTHYFLALPAVKLTSSKYMLRPIYTYIWHIFYDINCFIRCWRVIKVMAGAGGILMGHREG